MSSSHDAEKYPEHARRETADAACGMEHVRRFVEWLTEEREPRGFLGEHDQWFGERPIDARLDVLLAEYGGYDLNEIEEERRAMLDGMRGPT